MLELETLRHSCAHVLANAILRIWPEAQFAAGPPVENGFYYDVDLPHRISPEDFEKIEKEMAAIIAEAQPFQREVITREEAIAMGERGELAGLTPDPNRANSSSTSSPASPPERKSPFTATAPSPTSAPVPMWLTPPGSGPSA